MNYPHRAGRNWSTVVGVQGDAAIVLFTPPGAGGIQMSVNTALSKFPHKSHYQTNPQYVAAVQALRTGQIFAEQGAIIHRLPDRLLVGDAIDCTGDAAETGRSWLGTSPQPGLGWIEKNATFAAYASKGSIGVAGAARTSQMTGGASIGVVGVGYNDNAANTVNAWGAYFESKSTATALGPAIGVEIQAATLGAYTDFYSASATKTYTLLLGAGADPVINGATDSVTAAIVVESNGATFGRGLLFGGGSLRSHTDAEGLTHFKALTLRNSQQLGWEDSSGNSLGFVRSNVTAEASETSLFLSDNNAFVRGPAGAKIAQFAHAASAVNYVTFGNNAATGAPFISTSGTDTNIDLRLVPKGTGLVRFGTFTGSGDVPITGSVSIKDAGGTTRKLAVVA